MSRSAALLSVPPAAGKFLALAGAFCAAAVLSRVPARAQTIDAPIASIGVPPVAGVGRRDPGCRDFKRRPVRLIEVKALGDAGRAEYIGSGPVIKVDPEIMQRLPEGLQLFFELHECAHHALGHLFAPTLDSEKEADCWAIKEGVRRKVFTPSDIAQWRPHFENSRGSVTHLPGPQRVAFLANCVEE